MRYLTEAYQQAQSPQPQQHQQQHQQAEQRDSFENDKIGDDRPSVYNPHIHAFPRVA